MTIPHNVVIDGNGQVIYTSPGHNLDPIIEAIEEGLNTIIPDVDRSQDLLEEVKMLSELGVKRIEFIDDIFNVKAKDFKEFLLYQVPIKFVM